MNAYGKPGGGKRCHYLVRRRDKIFAQEWHSVDKIRFENERMPGNEQGTRLCRHSNGGTGLEGLGRGQDETEAKGSKEKVGRPGWVAPGWDNNFINKYLCGQILAFCIFAIRF